MVTGKGYGWFRGTRAWDGLATWPLNLEQTVDLGLHLPAFKPGLSEELGLWYHHDWAVFVMHWNRTMGTYLMFTVCESGTFNQELLYCTVSISEKIRGKSRYFVLCTRKLFW